MANTHQYWILKSEPSTYSFDDLLKDKGTQWDGVRNHQAKGFIGQMKVGDIALIYHSGKDKSVIGIANVTKNPYPDPDPKKKGDWLQVDIAPVEKLEQPITLAEIKREKALNQILLVRHTRLSVIPITQDDYNKILKLGHRE